MAYMDTISPSTSISSRSSSYTSPADLSMDENSLEAAPSAVSHMLTSSPKQNDLKILNRLEQLRSHPLFGDLQMTLAMDCLQSTVPHSLLPEHRRNSEDKAPGAKLDHTVCNTVSEGIMEQHMRLQTMLMNVRSCFPSLLSVYQQVTDQLESQRYRALAYNCYNDNVKQLINWFYDNERQLLMNRIKDTLGTLTGTNTELNCLPIPKLNFGLMKGVLPGMGLFDPQALFPHPPAAASLLKPLVGDGVDLERPLDLSGSNQTKKPGSGHIQGQQQPTGEKKSRFLSKKAVAILQAWYQKHRDHPYATDDEVRELALAGGITTNQRTAVAAEFLDQIAYIIIDQDVSNKEKVLRYDVMGDLYNELKFYRKASFFKRIAAMNCVNSSSPSIDWRECYRLLLQALPGFKMTFNHKDFYNNGSFSGWPDITMRVFNELIYAARQLGQFRIVIRHVSLYLHTMYAAMLPKEINDLVSLLETYTKDKPDMGLPLSTADGITLPPVPFTAFPYLSSFDVTKLPPNLEPHKSEKTLPVASVFIYSPLNLGKSYSREQSSIQYEFGWVKDNPGSIEVSLYNPLPLQLKVTDFSLIAEGIDFESYPSSHTLPPVSEPHAISIIGVPRQSGTLKITGYQMRLFGVVSRCMFQELDQFKCKTFIVDVAPQLPWLLISSELPRSPYMVTGGDNDIVTSAILQIYVGEQKDCKIILKNAGKVPVTKINVEISSKKHPNLISELLRLDSASLEQCLPLAPDAEAVLTVQTMGSMKLSDLPQQTLLSPAKEQKPSSALIETTLRITYTGEEGSKHKYHRESLMALDTVLIPSVDVISQDITSKNTDQCQVVYEVFNQSNMALDIESGSSSISLKPMQSDRIFCQVSKCSSNSSLASCYDSLNRFVQLYWFTQDRLRQGIINTSKLSWSDDQLATLKKRPFFIDCHTTSTESHYEAGDLIGIHFTVTNASDTTYSHVEISMKLSQESGLAEAHLVQEGSSYVYVGPSARHITQFSGGETAEFHTSIVIFHPGDFVIECQCLHDSRPAHDLGSRLSIIVT